MSDENVAKIWVRVAFSQDSVYGISNCYARLSIPLDSFLRSATDRFLILEDVVLPIHSEEDRRKSVTFGEVTLTPMKNLQRAFPGSTGKLYVNVFQITSIMPLDPNSEIVKTLERITSLSVVESSKKE
ncbi:hypothetical protein DRP77_07855 [Candidatus Poribacteria bacterium]|nr:MAG: hypothetical protein DRP77_07855 [Candidatus Poribacteria bacterium]